MGSAVAARLTANGVRVLTSFEGRSARSQERAAAAGMVPASDEELADARLILSIVPPAEAEGVVRRLLPHIAAAQTKPLYVDANALSPDTKRSLADLLAGAGCAMVDGGIIGPPPAADRKGTILYLSGPASAEAAWLGEHGLEVRLLDGPIGAAAALKMCFAGINKGLAGLGAAMVLAAERSGAGEALHAQLREMLPQISERLGYQIPDLYPKAYRWGPEMREIADFLEEDRGAALIFEGLAQLFDRLAADFAGEKGEQALLDRFLARRNAEGG
jgi:3-hydroxyisobutyrate dehydrogenase-like beta-hydroxyacid dehydrogenase